MSDELEYRVIKYDETFLEQWDNFIYSESVNGTFLQSRNFLNYHPQERFQDNSYIVLDKKENISAVIPACIIIENNKKLLYSHKGSTFGGIIIDKKSYKIDKIISIIKALERQAVSDDFECIIYKQTPDVYSLYRNEPLEYAFFYCGYSQNKEIGMMIDYAKYGENIMSNLTKGKKYNVNQCKKNNCQLVRLCSNEEIDELYDVLCQSLIKYDTNPVHNIDELLDLKNSRIKDECEFFGVKMNDRIIAGSMMFYFNKVNIAHTQYLCALPEYNKLSPMSFLYYAIIQEMKNRGFSKLTWGIVTEEQGHVLNEGLASSKEAFGGEYMINRTFIKYL